MIFNKDEPHSVLIGSFAGGDYTPPKPEGERDQ
jgi:hypothetical protein